MTNDELEELGQERVVRVDDSRPAKNGNHATGGVVFEKRWLGSVCREPGCKFNGRRAVQGVCFRNTGELARWDRLQEHSKRADDELAEIRRDHYTDDKEWIGWLEAMYTSTMINHALCLDELIRLRRENKLLKEELAVLSKRDDEG